MNGSKLLYAPGGNVSLFVEARCRFMLQTFQFQLWNTTTVENIMNSFFRIIIIFTLMFVTGHQAMASEGFKLSTRLTESLKKDAELIQEWVNEPVIVKAVEKQNAENLSMQVITQRDTAWIAVSRRNGSPDSFMKSVFLQPAGAWLREQNRASAGRYTEAFLCDNKGANVAVSDYTSDYWQGDEGKWIKSFNDGSGEVIIGQGKWDKSSNTVQVQISVPVMSGGKAIGVLVVGVQFKKLLKDSL